MRRPLISSKSGPPEPGTASPFQTDGARQHPVRHQIVADRQRGNRRRKHHRGGLAIDQPILVLAHYAAPVRQVRLNAQAPE